MVILLVATCHCFVSPWIMSTLKSVEHAVHWNKLLHMLLPPCNRGGNYNVRNSKIFQKGWQPTKFQTWKGFKIQWISLILKEKCRIVTAKRLRREAIMIYYVRKNIKWKGSECIIYALNGVRNGETFEIIYNFVAWIWLNCRINVHPVEHMSVRYLFCVC